MKIFHVLTLALLFAILYGIASIAYTLNQIINIIKISMELPDHYSYSQINTFLRCPMQYKLSYLDGIKQKPAFALNFGKAVHTGIERNYSQKIATSKNIPMEEMYAAYDGELAVAKKQVKDESEKEDYNDWLDTHDRMHEYGHKMLDKYQEHIGEKTQPQMVEQKFELDLDGRKFVGYIDLLDSHKILADTKTSGKKYQAGKVDNDLQLTMYYYALMKQFNIRPRGVRFDVLVKTKTPGVQQLTSDRNLDQMNEGMKIIKAAAEDIEFSFKRGYFAPRPDPLICSWCGYRQAGLCPYVSK